jgi:hypothetical protein
VPAPKLAASWPSLARPVSVVAAELGVWRRTVMNAVVKYGTPLVDHPDRIGAVEQLGVDETSFLAANRNHATVYATGRLAGQESVGDVSLADDPAEAAVLLDKAIAGCLNDEVPEIVSLGRTLARWRAEILSHHDTGASNGPTRGSTCA